MSPPPWIVALLALAALGPSLLPPGAALHCCPPPPVPPSAPEHFHAAAGPSRGQIQLTWEEPASKGVGTFMGYIVSRYVGLNADTDHARVGPTTLAFTDTGLADGSTYFYTVRGYVYSNHEEAQGPDSDVAGARTWSLPSAPPRLAASAGSGSDVVLAWDPPLDRGGTSLGGYRVYRADASSGPFALLAGVGDVLTYTDPGGAPASGARYYRVAAFNAVGEGAPSGLAPFPTSRPGAPPAVAVDYALQVAGSAAGWVRFQWQGAADHGLPITQHRIYRGTSPGFESYYSWTDGGARQFFDPLVLPGLTYYYRVSAVNAAGEGPLSPRACARPYFGLGEPCAA